MTKSFKFTLIVICFLGGQLMTAQRVFNKLTDLYSFVYREEGNNCPTFQDGSFMILYDDSVTTFDAAIRRKYQKFGVLHKFNKEGDVVAKQPNVFRIKNTAEYYAYDFFESYEDRLYGFGAHIIPYLKDSNYCYKYLVRTEFEKNTLKPIHTSEVELYIGLDTSHIGAIFSITHPVSDNLFFRSSCSDHDSTDFSKWVFNDYVSNFNFKENRFYVKKIPRDYYTFHHLKNAFVYGKDSFFSFYYLYFNKVVERQVDTIFIFNKDFTILYKRKLQINDPFINSTTFNNYSCSKNFFKPNEFIGYSTYIRDTLGKEDLSWSGTHIFEIKKDSFKIKKSVVRNTRFHGFTDHVGESRAATNIVINPKDSSYFFVSHVNSSFHVGNIVVYRLTKNHDIIWKRRYIDTSETFVTEIGDNRYDHKLRIGFDWHTGGIVVPFGALENGAYSNMYVLRLDSNGNALYVRNKDLTKIGVIDYSILPKATIFPNPSHDIINITIDEKQLNYYVKIYDLNGKIQNMTYGNPKKIEVSHLSKGHYILQIISENQEILHNQKIEIGN
jgi:hypothetical protein